MTATKEWRPAVGRVFGEWTILSEPHRVADEVLCRCSCGREKHVKFENILRGLSTKCVNCARRIGKTTHGASDAGGKKSADRLYRIWKAMKWRCNPKNEYDAELYHRRGIRVCEVWQRDFVVFRDWATANGYAEGLTIDRWPDKNGNYEPGNCRWIDWEGQARNTRRNQLVTAFGETKTAAEWALDSRCVVVPGTLYSRIRNGWGHEAAITSPAGDRRRSPSATRF